MKKWPRVRDSRMAAEEAFDDDDNNKKCVIRRIIDCELFKEVI